MSRALALQLLYEMVSDMTVANGFNYDWVVHKGGDKFLGVRANPAITINFGSETNVDDIGGIGSGEYRDDANFTITGKVAFGGANVTASNVDYEEERALAKALDDIKTRYDSGRYLCTGGVNDARVKYLGSESPSFSREQKFTTMRIVCNFNLKYTTQRKFIDG